MTPGPSRAADQKAALESIEERMRALYYTLELHQAAVQSLLPVYALKESLEAQMVIVKERIEKL